MGRVLLGTIYPVRRAFGFKLMFNRPKHGADFWPKPSKKPVGDYYRPSLFRNEGRLVENANMYKSKDPETAAADDDMRI